MRLEIYKPSEAKIWNDIVSTSLNGTLYHTWEWLKIAETNSGSRLYPLVFFDENDDRPFAAIPLFFLNKMGIKMVFSPPPGSSITLGPIIVDKGYDQNKFELAYVDFEKRVEDFMKGFGANYINIITSPGLLDVRPFSWANYKINPSYTYRIDLQQGEKVIWGNLSSSLRNAINKTRSKGVQIQDCDIDKIQGVDYVYDSLTHRYKDQNLTIPMKKAYLQSIVDQFGDSKIKILLAKYNERTVGAQITSAYKDTVTGWLGAVRFESNDLEINGFLLWEIISRSIRGGYKWLENMGANTQRLCYYKAKFCPTLSLYFEMKKNDWLGTLAEKAYFLNKRSISKINSWNKFGLPLRNK